MFERFTQGARDVVSGAVGYAGGAGEPRITEEHLLMALLDARGTKASFVLASLGATGWRERLAAALAEARRRGGMSQADAVALAGLGIDVDEIVDRIEEVHGRGRWRRSGPGSGRCADRSHPARRTLCGSPCGRRRPAGSAISATSTCSLPSSSGAVWPRTRWRPAGCRTRMWSGYSTGASRVRGC